MVKDLPLRDFGSSRIYYPRPEETSVVCNYCNEEVFGIGCCTCGRSSIRADEDGNAVITVIYGVPSAKQAT